ncbi:universal stress protein [Luteibacter aegosomaticola]|uniref:universal stress protein n=1 Tax=Luteibacter aegosomaticola TaxID=2911538 RepID=UPI001FFB5040|nr:universal stress protein [Luteibacter aegosomaticola]UPG88230.1 universal stress protein [Luteibacter aegosomaticola]
MFQHILIATDGSDVSDRAAKQAIDLASRLGARVLALHVVPALPAYAYFAQGIEGAIPTPDEASREDAECLERVQRLAKAHGVPCELRSVVDGRPYCEIVAIAEREGCDLIVMGSHGRQGLDRLLLGSETHKVLLSTRVPVLVCQ